MASFGRCPRCGGLSLEFLRTHAHCWECDYSPEDEAFARWLDLESRHPGLNKQLRQESYRIANGSTQPSNKLPEGAL